MSSHGSTASRRRRTALGLFVAAATSLSLASAQAGAAPITVNSNVDTVFDLDDACTLPEAITSANSDMASGLTPNECAAGNGTDAIGFAGSVTGTIQLLSPLPNILTNMSITGPGAGQLDVERGPIAPNFSILFVDAGVTASISGLTISNGKQVSVTAVGGGIQNSGNLTLTGVAVDGNQAVASQTLAGGFPFTEANGAGIYNGSGAELHLISSTVSDNVATSTAVNTGVAIGDNATARIYGAGVFSSGGTLDIKDSTISGNTGTASATGFTTVESQVAGAIYSDSAPAATISRSTVNGNTGTATRTGGTMGSASSFGAGISAFNPLTLDRVTVTGNAASAPNTSTGGIDASGPTITSSTISGNTGANSANLRLTAGPTVRNVIVANPIGGPNCLLHPTITEDHNLEFPGTTCNFIGTGDVQGMNPLLGTLSAAPGEPTATFALMSGSPAIDAGLSSPGETTDQRGLARPADLCQANGPSGNGSDIGAFEVQGSCPATPSPTLTPTLTPAPGTSAAAGPTGQQAAALAKCKKKKGKARKKCKKKAAKLPA